MVVWDNLTSNTEGHSNIFYFCIMTCHKSIVFLHILFMDKGNIASYAFHKFRTTMKTYKNIWYLYVLNRITHMRRVWFSFDFWKGDFMCSKSTKIYFYHSGPKHVSICFTTCKNIWCNFSSVQVCISVGIDFCGYFKFNLFMRFLIFRFEKKETCLPQIIIFARYEILLSETKKN